MKKINITEKEIRQSPLTIDEIEKQKSFFNKKLKLIEKEFRLGFDFIKKYPKSITFFGSTRFKENNKYYEKARDLAKLLSKEGYAIVTGGGPGIMEAANRGAVENNSKGISIGYGIQLPHEQVINPYVTENLNFHYFFSRKVMLSFSAEVYVYFPGGYGTMDEFFEILTLVQTGKLKKVPIILFGSEYWNKFDKLIKETLFEEFKTIDKEDVDLYTITDDIEDVMKIIRG
ncbi:MAG: TIGR00730 family Rossman fold protein [Candidatus Pacebacteria bacterium]|nr:TIGR00730 family Rossman fold protein [Candidatus Paceibacterota bacterium]